MKSLERIFLHDHPDKNDFDAEDFFIASLQK